MASRTTRAVLRIRLALQAFPKKLQVLLAFLVAAGVVAATGTFITQLTPVQTVTTAMSMSITPDPATTSSSLGALFQFTVNVVNPSGSDALVHLHFSMTCPTGPPAGQATFNYTSPSTDLCTTPVQTDSFTVPANDNVDIGPYTIRYTGAAGSYTWDVTLDAD